MEVNASNAGVNKGGLISQAQIKILICYILDAVKEPVPSTRLSELLHYEGIANYFEVDSAFAALLKNGQIALQNEKDQTYTITQNGSAIAKELRRSLPFTIREKACAAAVKLLNRMKSSRENNIQINQNGAGYLVTCSVEDNGITMLSAGIHVTDLQQAQKMKDAFLERADKIFTDIVNTLTSTNSDEE